MIIQILDRATRYLIYEGYVSLSYLKDLQQDRDFIIIVIAQENVA